MTTAPFPWKPRVCPCYHHSMEPEARPGHFLVVVTRSRLQRRLVTRVVPMLLYKPGLTPPFLHSQPYKSCGALLTHLIVLQSPSCKAWLGTASRQ